VNRLHEQADFSELLRAVAADLDRDIAMVEKDYWVVATLAAIVDQGFEVWFKGGTSLAKGFGLIERFSEDLDVRIDAGRVPALTDPSRAWTNDKPAAVREREAWFTALARTMVVPGCTVARDPAGSDPACRSAWIEVRYPSVPGATPTSAMRPFVLVEAGRARVVPCVLATVSSWAGDWLVAHGGGGLPPAPRVTLRCVHPLVTALEKIDAIVRRFPRGDRPAATFVRHYEDVARIVGARERLAPLDGGIVALQAELQSAKDIGSTPTSEDVAFLPNPADARWTEVKAAWQAIGPWFWGPRLTLDDACNQIRALLDELDEGGG
jgi:hypothetical protein